MKREAGDGRLETGMLDPAVSGGYTGMMKPTLVKIEQETERIRAFSERRIRCRA